MLDYPLKKKQIKVSYEKGSICSVTNNVINIFTVQSLHLFVKS